MTFAVCVTFTLHPGVMETFLPLVRDNAKASLAQEPGCLRFDVLTDPSSPDEVFLYELYDDPEAFQVHLKASHFLMFDRMVAPMIADKIIKTYESVTI